MGSRCYWTYISTFCRFRVSTQNSWAHGGNYGLPTVYHWLLSFLMKFQRKHSKIGRLTGMMVKAKTNALQTRAYWRSPNSFYQPFHSQKIEKVCSQFENKWLDICIAQCEGKGGGLVRGVSDAWSNNLMRGQLSKPRGPSSRALHTTLTLLLSD